MTSNMLLIIMIHKIVSCLIQRDFKPIDISSLPVLKAIKREGTLRVAAGAMETQTMSQLQFLRYDVKPMVMARDSHPDYYCPPQTKFDGSTTTGETFKGKQTPRRLAFQPDASNIDIKSGSFDFNTTQKLEFKNHGLSMCEAKAYMIAKALHDEKLKKQVKALSSSCSEVTVQAQGLALRLIQPTNTFVRKHGSCF